MQTCSIQGELYGLSTSAVEVVAAESLACIVHLELEVTPIIRSFSTIDNTITFTLFILRYKTILNTTVEVF